MSAPYAREQQIAIAAVLKASLVAGKVQDELIGTGGVTKSDKSPVTGERGWLLLLQFEGWREGYTATSSSTKGELEGRFSSRRGNQARRGSICVIVRNCS